MYKIKVSFLEDGCELWEGELSPPLEIGRQGPESGTIAIGAQNLLTRRRLTIASVTDRAIPRQAIHIELAVPRQLKVINTTKHLAFQIDGRKDQLSPGEVHISDQPICIFLPGNRMIRVSLEGSPDETSLTGLSAEAFSPEAFIGHSIGDLAEHLRELRLRDLRRRGCEMGAVVDFDIKPEVDIIDLHNAASVFQDGAIRYDPFSTDVCPQATPPVPLTIPDVDITSLLGSGAFGTVYSGKLRQSGEDVAVKLIELKRGLRGSRDAGMAANEALNIARLRHPNIVRVHGMQPAGGFWIIVMELLVGRRLAAGIYKNPRRAMAQLSNAVLHMIDASIVHRDLKPDNIIVRETDMNPVVLDLGLSVNLEVMPANPGVAGTPYFMPPEAWDKKITRAYDAYSLGVTAARVLKADSNWPKFEVSQLPSLKASGQFTTIILDELAGIDRDLWAWIKDLLSPNQEARIKALNRGARWQLPWWKFW